MAHLSRHPAHAHLSPGVPAAQPVAQRKAADLGGHAAGAGKTRPADQPEAARLLPQGSGLECGSGWLWGGFGVALGWLWGAYQLAINTLCGGFDVALMWLWVALLSRSGRRTWSSTAPA